ncbi:hypothetical protein [Staphylococcus simulans]|uniref:hypothetical protein n=1 Tax=Staphylococcus simulans TaxID=1286 RepID=UPI000D1EE833|nr:hypothetical protein [Staphylococcus simulans]PTJ01302.1 hypothetical protein BU046_13230 [Staphylococcus simulans]PTJ07716.1 hypothetical protein BU044_13010 [Staphylococcus simulans]PTJ36221.1 hypothetical protein BU021_13040 [Staphylococcus simulans]
MWVLFLKMINGQYEVVQGGYNIVPTQVYDKVLPTTERIAKQLEKVYFDGERLRVKDGEELLPLESLTIEAPETIITDEITTEIYDVDEPQSN